MDLAPTSGTDGSSRDPGPSSKLVRVNAPQTFWRGFIPTVKEIIACRELLGNLTRKELKVRYKDSTLGFFWSLLRPAFLLTIYYLVFGVILKAQIYHFAIYMFSGLVAYDLFSNILGGSTSCIIYNSGLIKKVYFPREILPLAVIGSSLFHSSLQMGVLLLAEIIFGHAFIGFNLLLMPLALVALVLFGTALGLLLAAANVYLRDVQHLLELVILFWFWTTPIVYSISLAEAPLKRHQLFWLYLANPMTNIVIGFQRAFYGQAYTKVTDAKTGIVSRVAQVYTGNMVERLLVVCLVSSVFLWFAQRVFARAQGNFAQEL